MPQCPKCNRLWNIDVPPAKGDYAAWVKVMCPQCVRAMPSANAYLVNVLISACCRFCLPW